MYWLTAITTLSRVDGAQYNGWSRFGLNKTDVNGLYYWDRELGAETRRDSSPQEELQTSPREVVDAMIQGLAGYVLKMCVS